MNTLDHCYFCKAKWGSCTCAFLPIYHDETINPSAETVPGFEFEDFYITAPNVDVSGRFFVDPTAYYGEAYTKVAHLFACKRKPDLELAPDQKRGIQNLADEALQHAVVHIQSKLGITDGGVAGVYFTGSCETIIVELLATYIEQELAMRSKG